MKKNNARNLLLLWIGIYFFLPIWISEIKIGLLLLAIIVYIFSPKKYLVSMRLITVILIIFILYLALIGLWHGNLYLSYDSYVLRKLSQILAIILILLSLISLIDTPRQLKKSIFIIIDFIKN